MFHTHVKMFCSKITRNIFLHCFYFGQSSWCFYNPNNIIFNIKKKWLLCLFLLSSKPIVTVFSNLTIRAAERIFANWIDNSIIEFRKCENVIAREWFISFFFLSKNLLLHYRALTIRALWRNHEKDRRDKNRQREIRTEGQTDLKVTCT
jgi:hypothetical protein